MQFTLTIDMDNDSFEEGNYELLACLVRVGADLPQQPAPQDAMSVRDTNGNTVGKWRVSA